MIESFSDGRADNKKENNQEGIILKIEIAKEDDWEDYKSIRLEAIEKEPMAFYVTKTGKEKEFNKSETEWKSDITDPNSFIILSRKEKTPIGMVQSISKVKDENQWHIRGVYLKEDFRGSGCGKDMMNMTLDEIKRRGGKKVTLNVMDTQEIARKIYEKLGFNVTSKFEPEVIDGVQYPGGQWMIKEI